MTLTDVINVAGHRLSTGQIEEVLQTHPEVSECAVFGIKDELKGRLPFGFIVLNKNAEARGDHARVERECIQLVRQHIGPVAAFKLCRSIHRLPKTRSVCVYDVGLSSFAPGVLFVPYKTLLLRPSHAASI